MTRVVFSSRIGLVIGSVNMKYARAMQDFDSASLPFYEKKGSPVHFDKKLVSCRKNLCHSAGHFILQDGECLW